MRADFLVAVLNGATAIACLGIALFFCRFLRESNDRLFLCLCVAFVAFTLNYAVLGVLPIPDEGPLRGDVALGPDCDVMSRRDGTSQMRIAGTADQEITPRRTAYRTTSAVLCRSSFWKM